jgi:GDP-D-mannose 3', 5'-epimerase
MTGSIDKVYVTGVAGMIGSNIARSLLESGFSVVGIDNLWRGTKRNIADLLAKQEFSFRHADIIGDRDWYRDMDRQSTLIHVADIVAGIGYVFANEWSVFQKNILINSQIARTVNELKPRHLIYLGTACSYPQKLQRSVDTSVLSEANKLPADPESGYGWSKLVGEIEFRLAVKDTATRFTVLDLHNVYGWPCIYRDSTSQVIPSLIFKALNAKDRRLSVWGSGAQGRAFLHVTDVVAAVQSALQYSGSESTFMIGPDHCTTIAEVARLIQDHPRVGIDQIVFDTSKPTGDIGRFADSRLALRELGWTPKTEFRAGLHDLIDRIIDDSE